MVFPEISPIEGLDKDHVFPVSKFNPGQLTAAGVPLAELGRWTSMADLLPNLQLLELSDNRDGKPAKLPKAWFDSLGPTAKKRYTMQDVKYLPTSMAGFEAFWHTRREKLQRGSSDS